MRALCGAIIMAGALIGLGLTAYGVGTRYQLERVKYDEAGKTVPLHLGDMDRPLIFILVFLTSAAVVGLGIALLGLAYHHLRRHNEFLREREGVASTHRTSV